MVFTVWVSPHFIKKCFNRVKWLIGYITPSWEKVGPMKADSK